MRQIAVTNILLPASEVVPCTIRVRFALKGGVILSEEVEDNVLASLNVVALL